MHKLEILFRVFSNFNYNSIVDNDFYLHEIMFNNKMDFVYKLYYYDTVLLSIFDITVSNTTKC